MSKMAARPMHGAESAEAPQGLPLRLLHRPNAYCQGWSGSRAGKSSVSSAQLAFGTQDASVPLAHMWRIRQLVIMPAMRGK